MRRIIPLILLTACGMGGNMISMNAFYSVEVSATAQEVVAALGEPYAIYDLSDGAIEYEYVERIKIGARDAEERRYFIVMKNGVVISKRVKQSSPLPYGFDSYDMQTTQNNGEAQF